MPSLAARSRSDLGHVVGLRNKATVSQEYTLDETVLILRRFFFRICTSQPALSHYLLIHLSLTTNFFSSKTRPLLDLAVSNCSHEFKLRE